MAWAASASEQDLARLLVRRSDVIIDGFSGLLTQFEANGMSGFLLADGCPIDCDAVRRHVLNREADDITASQLAVDGKIEHCQVSNATLDLELGPYQPDIFGSERWLRTDQLSVIPWAPRRIFATVCNRYLHGHLLCCRRQISMLRLSWTEVVGPVSAHSNC
jgi:hypothetical protein